MNYIENPFSLGQEVVCISEIFPVVETTKKDKSEIGTQARIHPKKGEVLSIDEILGEYIRFNKYDTDAYNWWKHTHFRALTYEESKAYSELEITTP